jgi:hypothetical protein
MEIEIPLAVLLSAGGFSGMGKADQLFGDKLPALLDELNTVSSPHDIK